MKNSAFKTESFLKSAQETLDFGEELGSVLEKDSVLCFFGDLGAGKTTLIKGIAKGLGIKPEHVSSPTFQILHIYEGEKIPLFHFDLYRLRTEIEFLSMGFDEHFYKGGISCIEWAERIEGIIPQNAYKIRITHQDAGRIVTIEGLSA